MSDYTQPRKNKPAQPAPEIPVPDKQPELTPEFPEEEPFAPEREPEILPEREPDEPFPPEFPLPATRLGLLLLSLFFLLEACQKEKIIPNPNLTPYNIRQIAVVSAYADAPDDTLVYYFTYNSLGEPLTVKHAEVATGNPNAVFQYDKYGRFTGYVRPYDNGFYETYTKYFYDNRNQIARDSQYTFGTYMDSIPIGIPQYGGSVHWYKYDGTGRIIQRIDSLFGGLQEYGSIETFTYDQFGDLETERHTTTT